MTSTAAFDIDPGLVALARAKLAGPVLRSAELDRLAGLLGEGEQVVTLCDARCRSGAQEWSGLVALTDERLICLYTGASEEPPTQFMVSAMSSIEVGAPLGSGDAKRGALAMLLHGVETHLVRVRPWKRAEEIVEHISAAIAARATT